jgi:hypothetical protein
MGTEFQSENLRKYEDNIERDLKGTGHENVD